MSRSSVPWGNSDFDVVIGARYLRLLHIPHRYVEAQGVMSIGRANADRVSPLKARDEATFRVRLSRVMLALDTSQCPVVSREARVMERLKVNRRDAIVGAVAVARAVVGGAAHVSAQTGTQS